MENTSKDDMYFILWCAVTVLYCTVRVTVEISLQNGCERRGFISLRWQSDADGQINRATVNSKGSEQAKANTMGYQQSNRKKV